MTVNLSIRCDRCGVQAAVVGHPRTLPAHAIRAILAKTGWRQDGDLDLCPACLDKARTKNEAFRNARYPKEG
jgi:hypothetical protein